jgi:hypothetical protein
MTKILGTCREHLENKRYTKLVKKYDEHTAETLIKEQLNDAGVSVNEFRTYRKVKSVFQHGKINVHKAQKTAEKEAQETLDGLLA